YRSYSERITIAVPVTLRSFFPSSTLRNFFGVVHIGVAVTEKTTLKEIIEERTEQLLEKVQKDKLQRSSNDREKRQRKLSARFVPLPLKYQAIRNGYHSYSERTKAMTLTNLEQVRLSTTIE